MPNPQTGKFQIDFENLINVLAENLYSDPKAAIRELIQNANDSIVRRIAFYQDQSTSFVPTIHITTHRESRQLIIEDNGAGMIEREVINYLARIGGGRTREDRRILVTKDPQATTLLIGQFGIGFLSAFVAAEEVIVDTLSVEHGVPVRWECKGTAEYQLSRGNRTEPGTQVILHLKQAHYDLLDEQILQDAIIRYADLIAFPIYLNENGKAVNRTNAPWYSDATEAEYAEYIQHRYNTIPLALKPIATNQEDLQVKGVLYVPPQAKEFKGRFRSVDLFQNRMYVGEDLNILPDWANFVCGVLDCSTLDLVASREAIIRDKPSYKALQDYLAQSVANFVRRLAEIERPTFQKIILQHDWRVIQGGVLNDFFFDEIKDLMPFQSDIGPLTLPKYLERVPNRAGNTKTIYYIPSELPLGQQQSVLFQVRGIPIIRADNFTERFLEKYVKHNKNVNLRQIASGVVELMEPAQEAQWRTLEAHYQQIGIIAKAVRFYPPEIPAIAVRQADYDQNRLIEQIVRGDGQLLDFMEKIGAEKSDVYGLALNVENPLLERLASFKGNQKVLNTALRAIYASALLASNVDLTIELSQTVAYDQMKIIELLLEQAKQIEN